MLTAKHPSAAASRTRLNGRAGRLLAVAAAILLPAVAALAQPGSVDDLVVKNEITAADRQAIKRAIDDNKAGLSGDTDKVKKSREALVAPLEKTGITVPFRIAYGNALIESAEIAKLAKSEKDIVAVNALRIAGQAATGNTLAIILDGLKDERAPVRVAATVAARAAFVAARNNPAITQEEIARAVKALSDVVANDKSDEVIDGALQAMIAAREYKDFRSRAVEILAAAAGKRAMFLARSGKPFDLAPLLRVAAALREETLDAAVLTPEARKAAALFGAQVLLAVDALWQSDDPTPLMATTAKAANGVTAEFAKSDATIGTLIIAGKQPQFKAALAKLIDLLKGEPLRIPADQLKP